MAQYKTPGVYVKEVSTFPPSVAEVSTAVPAFIGYTETVNEGEIGEPIRITSFLEYQTIFGGPQPASFSLSVSDPAKAESSLALSPTSQGASMLMSQYMDMYFKNGGGACYVVSLGGYDSVPTVKQFQDALDALHGEDEPTLYVFPDALQLGAGYYEVAKYALKECNDLGDRFTIIDMPKDADEATFRGGIKSDYLRYGAAYTPYLDTALNQHFDENKVMVSGLAGVQISDTGYYNTSANGLHVTYSGPKQDAPQLSIVDGGSASTSIAINGNHLTITVNGGAVQANTVLNKWTTFAGANDTNGFNMVAQGTGADDVTSGITAEPLTYDTVNSGEVSLASLKQSKTGVYNAALKLLGQQRVIAPPSPAMAGVYAAVDRERGVWKAPANRNLAAVVKPIKKITNNQQDSLNVDPDGGMSINAIRTFTGQGTVVWGARTLMGNDNEWRYISVRRLFNMVEESTRKATSFAVFEPNDATTWLKVRGMIEAYLFGLYEQGAFAGSTPEAAYYVNVGLGTTMTPQDILEGRMYVEIGLAAVRPAEFIILKFSHKLQEA